MNKRKKGETSSSRQLVGEADDLVVPSNRRFDVKRPQKRVKSQFPPECTHHLGRKRGLQGVENASAAALCKKSCFLSFPSTLSSETPSFCLLPQALFSHLLSYLSLLEIYRLSCVNKQMCNACRSFSLLSAPSIATRAPHAVLSRWLGKRRPEQDDEIFNDAPASPLKRLSVRAPFSSTTAKFDSFGSARTGVLGKRKKNPEMQVLLEETSLEMGSFENSQETGSSRESKSAQLAEEEALLQEHLQLLEAMDAKLDEQEALYLTLLEEELALEELECELEELDLAERLRAAKH